MNHQIWINPALMAIGAILLLYGYGGQIAFNKNHKNTSSMKENSFIKISSENGGFEWMLEHGKLGELGSTQIYFIKLIQERDIKMEQQFIVLKLRRHDGEENKAYQLLDDFNRCNGAFHANVSDESNWSEEAKLEFKNLRERAPWVREQFRKHVKINIEKESLTTGISDRGFLTYE